jgi:hypothetical protein
MEYINRVAPPSAGVAVSGPMSNAAAFARQDLHLGDVSEMETDPDFEPVVIVACSWATIDPGFFSDAPLTWSVERRASHWRSQVSCDTRTGDVAGDAVERPGP